MKVLLAVFDYQEEQKKPWLTRISLLIIYFFGFFLWGKFMDWGNFPVNFEDWSYVTAPRLAFLQDAVRSFQFPLHMPDASALLSQTDRFLSVPDVILSPQIILTGWLGVQEFVLFNVLLLFTIGFLGLLAFRKKFTISLSGFFWVFLLFNFNGHILSHLAIGHAHWAGYFLFPWFMLFIFKFIEGDTSWRWVFSCSLVFFFVFLQGAYHQYVWMLMVLGIIGLVYWRNFLGVLKVLVFANGLSMVRILPAVLLFGDFSEGFLGGYPLKRYMLETMIQMRAPQAGQAYPAFTNPLGYWEFNLYIGVLGVVFVVLFGGLILTFRQVLVASVHWSENFQAAEKRKRPGKVWHWLSIIQGWFLKLKIKSKNSNPRWLGLFVPIILMGWFSIRDNFEIVSQFGIPLLSSERVATRFLLLSFLLLLFMAVKEYQWLLDQLRKFWPLQVMLSGLSIVLAVDLWKHAMLWKVSATAAVFPELELDLSAKVVANHSDPLYISLIASGILLSGLTLLFLIRKMRQEVHLK
ncbi:MAG: hypothetical protein JEZ06_09375 [Anaerolineaceae bacterium]|nr:hypothetical protein [Anaerolineaceae bacterium]